MSTSTRLAAAALCVAALAACSSKTPEEKPKIVSISELEAQVHHHVLTPGASLGARLLNATYGNALPPLFTGQMASATYEWRDFVVLVRQGRPPEGFALKSQVRQDATLLPKDSNGVEIALLPALGEKGLAIGYRLEGSWLVEVDVAIASSPTAATIQQLRTFMAALS
jgi:hypothetical protein